MQYSEFIAQNRSIQLLFSDICKIFFFSLVVCCYFGLCNRKSSTWFSVTCQNPSAPPERTKKGPERGSGPYHLLVPYDGRWCFVMTRVISYLARLERLLLISQGSNDYFLSRKTRTITSYLARLERLLLISQGSNDYFLSRETRTIISYWAVRGRSLCVGLRP